MPVQSIECQLTQAQMKRYLAGADFPDEILGALERHLKVCSECMHAANLQREALGGAPVVAGQAVVATAAKPSILGKLKALRSGATSARTPPKGLVGAPGKDPYADPLAAFKSPKNLVLSASLAVVLVLMSTVLRNPTGLLGPRAAAVLGTTAPTTQETTPKKPQDTEPLSADKTPVTPKTENNETSKPVDKAPTSEPDKSAPSTTVAPDDTASVAVAKPPVTKPVKAVEKDPLGGQVLVAESGTTTSYGGSKPSVKKPVSQKDSVTKSSTKPVTSVKKPVVKAPVKSTAVAKKTATAPEKTPTHARTLKSVRRPATKKTRPTRKARVAHPRNGVRVYLPDGSVKH